MKALVIVVSMVMVAAVAMAASPATPSSPSAAKTPAKRSTASTVAKTPAKRSAASATTTKAKSSAAKSSAAKPSATPGAKTAGREGPRTLQDIHIEGEIPVPQVLFITARDQRRFLDFQHRRYLKTSQQVGEQTALPSWIGVTGQQPTDAGKENPR